MKVYAIRDKTVNKQVPIGYLICYEKANEYIIELQEFLDEWNAPLLFQKYVRENRYTIPKEAAKLWVRERVIPSGRQNIGSILKNAKLKEYNELVLLDLSAGKCSQDACFLEEITFADMPENIRDRSSINISECFCADNKSVVCLFKDGLARKVSLEKMVSDYDKIVHLLRNEALFRAVKVGVGGYGISFDDNIEISLEMLRNPKYDVAFVAEDFRYFVKNNIVDTSEACKRMQCSRQNMHYLVNAGKVRPIKDDAKENLYTLGSIERMRSE